MTKEFYMLVGLPGSGKTSLVKYIVEERKKYHTETQDDRTIVWISSDKIREELYGSEEIQGDPKEIFSEMRKRTEQALKEGNDVIYDACNINSKKRRGLLSSIKHFNCKKVCIVCATPYEMCKERNSQRERKVPETAIEKMYLNWNTPFYFEGWDKIEIFFAEKTRGSFGTPLEFVQKHMMYNQDNPYHLETLGEHLLGTQEQLLAKEVFPVESNISIAALLHDCGKPYTKTFTDTKGNATEIAHYYQHACVGAYDALFYDYPDKTNEDIVEISMLINLHMNPFSWKKLSTKDKQIQLLGKEIYEKIIFIHKADESASHTGL